MSFLQPLFLAGLLAASLPIIIHLINRRKAVRRRFPALQLLRESNEKIARSVKVRQWLLLALRVLAIAVLIFALAKPFVLSSDGLTADERLPTAVALVVDDSVAMTYDDYWERALDAVDDEIDGLRHWDEVVLLTTGDSDSPVTSLTTEHGEIRDGADELESTYAGGDLAETLLKADDVLAGSDLPNRRITVISSGTDAAVGSSRDIQLMSPVDVVDIGDRDDGPLDNTAVVDVDYTQRGSARDGQWTIDAVVANFGTDDRHQLPVELEIDGDTVAADTVDVPGGESATISFEHHLEQPRLVDAAVVIADDAGLEADNRWHFAIQPRQRTRTLLVNGSPSSIPYNDELFFLSRALEPATRDGGTISLSETTRDGLDSRNLDNYDVVVLANVSALSSELADQLHRFVDGGGGLFISVGDQIDEDAYNQQLDGLLPRPLRGIKLLAERDDPDAPIKTTRLGHPTRQHPVFESSRSSGSRALQSVSVYSYMLLDPAPSDANSSVLLSYQDNAPALLERRVGQGRVLLFTSSIDRDWTDFPVRSAFLPLVHRSLMHLARRASSDADDVHGVGESIDFDIGELVDDRAIVHGPDGSRTVLTADERRASMTPNRPGVYYVYADNEGDAHLIDSLTFSANVDRDISPLAAFPDDMVEGWAGERRAGALAEGDRPADERRINLWSYFLFGLALLLLAETVLGARRSVLVSTAEKLAFWREPTSDSAPTA